MCGSNQKTVQPSCIGRAPGHTERSTQEATTPGQGQGCDLRTDGVTSLAKGERRVPLLRPSCPVVHRWCTTLRRVAGRVRPEACWRSWTRSVRGWGLARAARPRRAPSDPSRRRPFQPACLPNGEASPRATCGMPASLARASGGGASSVAVKLPLDSSASPSATSTSTDASSGSACARRAFKPPSWSRRRRSPARQRT